VKPLLERLLAGQDLSTEEAGLMLEALADGATPPALAGALLAALRAKGETVEEIVGFASALRRLARRPQLPAGTAAIDVVGTGGDGSGSLNLSTASALLVAACGQSVVKHGNRSISSRCGSADVLEQLGVVLPTDEAQALDCLGRTGFCFLFAPSFHPAMASLGAVRRSLGVRTVFNLLGPLTNPAEPPYGLLGAFSLDAARMMAETLARLPIRRVFVVHGTNGWDEATPCSAFHLFDVRPGEIRAEMRDPLALGFERCQPSDLTGGDAAHNALRLRAVFDGEGGAHRDAVVLGAALALEAAGVVPAVAEGRERAEDAIDRGAARQLLEALRA
jgi:anthranilate phosphoribosyltransferase